MRRCDGDKKTYVPDAGDIVWLHFTPQAGHEQAGHRPVVVLSPAVYNGKTGLMLCCPLTTQTKGYPFEVSIAGKPASVALSDQVKSLDWRVRQAEKKSKVKPAELAAIRTRAKALIRPQETTRHLNFTWCHTGITRGEFNQD